MKTVSGKVISSKSLSLSKAASILSTFVTVDNGASPAVSYYLRRASEAFEELNQFHKELRTPKSRRKSKNSVADSVDPPGREIELRSNCEDVERDSKKNNKKGKKVGEGQSEEGDMISELRSGLELANGDQKFEELENEKKKKYKSKKEGRKIEGGDTVERSEAGPERKVGSKENVEKKGQDGNEVEEEGAKYDSAKKKKNKNKKGVEGSSSHDNEVAVGDKEGVDGKLEETKRRKKRKSSEIAEDGVEDGSVEEHHSKKTKRRKAQE